MRTQQNGSVDEGAVIGAGSESATWFGGWPLALGLGSAVLVVILLALRAAGVVA